MNLAIRIDGGTGCRFLRVSRDEPFSHVGAEDLFLSELEALKLGAQIQ